MTLCIQTNFAKFDFLTLTITPLQKKLSCVSIESTNIVKKLYAKIAIDIIVV